ncbi:hypothetical protein, partial [Salmonella enterica]|uniref:hypothetical protein n=1 Tax=Salmonella enterica TaxID=28901 RepID=UPI003EDBF3F4
IGIPRQVLFSRGAMSLSIGSIKRIEMTIATERNPYLTAVFVEMGEARIFHKLSGVGLFYPYLVT